MMPRRSFVPRVAQMFIPRCHMFDGKSALIETTTYGIPSIDLGVNRAWSRTYR